MSDESEERSTDRRLQTLCKEMTALKKKMSAMNRQQEELASLVVFIGKTYVKTHSDKSRMTCVKNLG